jgi:hypothetical protein
VLRGAAWQSDKVEVGLHPFFWTRLFNPLDEHLSVVP